MERLTRNRYFRDMPDGRRVFYQRTREPNVQMNQNDFVDAENQDNSVSGNGISSQMNRMTI